MAATARAGQNHSKATVSGVNQPKNRQEGDQPMEETQNFRVVAWWASGKTGLAKSNSAPNAIHFTSPPAFGGLEGRWTPEDLLLCAVASCYTTTFRTLADYSKLNYTDLQVEVEAAIAKADSGYSFGEILLRANLTIPLESEQGRAEKLLHKADHMCLVSRALALKPAFQPSIKVGVPVG
jgi:organic hydroperoxide reductase OsmC/OhrA